MFDQAQTEVMNDAKGASVQTEAYLEIRDVAKLFGDTVALERVNLTIRKGEFFSLLGPSGCGKTTLMRMIGGFEAPSSGDIRIDGSSVVHLAPHSRPTNMVFQSLALFPHLNVRENIAFGLRIAGLSKKEMRDKIASVLSVIRLEDFADREVSALSGGQQQRVAIARALVNEPKVLLLDEPLSALDSKLREEMQEELRRIQKHVGSTFVFVTHDQAEAMSMSDRIAVINDGRLQQIGTPEELYAKPRNRFVAHFIGNSTLFDGVVENGTAGPVLRSGDLELSCMPPEGVSMPFKATGALRFESVSVLPEAAGKGRLATVISRKFHGAFTRVRCDMDGCEVAADVKPTGMAIEPGSKVRLAWEPDALRILPTVNTIPDSNR
ncbi:ABC transporter ATP-binding protein [Oceanicola sp. 22II-s10i]|uniref:ABC transporter ATP-binding protein n=1 Tax=Oceanicola sp. 22II-s10i TaxID=1317116 RepID=UPI0020CD284E|nr:ABC transporter ATP-binding protein [Oceanicola sp. 22II-s10i]